MVEQKTHKLRRKGD